MSAHSRRLPRLLCLIALVAAGALPAPGPARAQQVEPEVVLPAGIRYPGGYDPNTVGLVEGRVAAFSRPEQGPVTFRLESPGVVYTVLAAPAWYWEEQKLAVRDGERVQVKGSKTMSADGNLDLIAQEIVLPSADRPVVLRDARGKPAWSGCGPKGCRRDGR